MKISQAMIVKNEEKNIGKALGCVKGVAFEQIVVDTGSTDDTVRIAEEAGATVYHFDWINDFAAAKNFAIDKCKGDWIVFLDADEYFEDASNLYEVISKAEEKKEYVIASKLLNLNDEGKVIGTITQPRVFKNHVGIKYEGKIHEHLKNDQPTDIYDATDELIIYHTGYSETVYNEKNKDKLYKTMLEKAIAENPGDSDLYGYLGDIYAKNKKYAKAEELYFKSIKYMDDKVTEESERRGDTLRHLLMILGEDKKRTGDILKIYNYARAILPHDADFSCVVADHYYRFKKYKKAADYYKEAIDIYDKYGSFQRSDHVEAYFPKICSKMLDSYYQEKEYTKVVEESGYCIGKQKYNAEYLGYLMLAFKALRQNGNVELKTPDEIKIINDLYDLGTIKDKAFVFVIAYKTDDKEVFEHVISLCSKAELEAFKQQLL